MTYVDEHLCRLINLVSFITGGPTNSDVNTIHSPVLIGLRGH